LDLTLRDINITDDNLLPIFDNIFNGPPVGCQKNADITVSEGNIIQIRSIIRALNEEQGRKYWKKRGL
jgi:hypothetical protein